MAVKKKYKQTRKYDDVVMSFDAINEFRKREGLPVVIKGERLCMCCKRKFRSDDIDKVRICDACKNNSESGGIGVCSIAL
jgi:predicted Zn-ribbon and HTH transcriptional regulator